MGYNPIFRKDGLPQAGCPQFPCQAVSCGIPEACKQSRPDICSSAYARAHLQVWGRIQSREYQKKLSDTEFEKRVAYEVSVSKLDLIEKDETGGLQTKPSRYM